MALDWTPYPSESTSSSVIPASKRIPSPESLPPALQSLPYRDKSPVKTREGGGLKHSRERYWGLIPDFLTYHPCGSSFSHSSKKVLLTCPPYTSHHVELSSGCWDISGKATRLFFSAQILLWCSTLFSRAFGWSAHPLEPVAPRKKNHNPLWVRWSCVSFQFPGPSAYVRTQVHWQNKTFDGATLKIP